jgi:hypothetical protein
MKNIEVPMLSLALLLLLQFETGCKAPEANQVASKPAPTFTLIQPELLNAPQIPEPPIGLIEKSEKARIVLGIIVLPTGKVSEVTYVSGPQKLQHLALNWALGLVFRPGTLNGIPQHFRMKATILWSPTGNSYELLAPKSKNDWK